MLRTKGTLTHTPLVFGSKRPEEFPTPCRFTLNPKPLGRLSNHQYHVGLRPPES